MEGLDGAFPEELRINFFRIVQEAVNNIVKHSNATAAWITAKVENSALHLSISDNGKGLVPEAQNKSPRSGGFGLTGMPGTSPAA